MEEEVEEEEFLSRLRADEEGFDPKLKSSGNVHRNSGEVSLREWLDRPKIAVDFVECLHILFRQVVEAVNLAFSFIESASCSDTSCGEEEGSYAAGAAASAAVIG